MVRKDVIQLLAFKQLTMVPGSGEGEYGSRQIMHWSLISVRVSAVGKAADDFEE